MNNYVKVYRALHNLTQARLAEKLGVSRATINAIEKGRYDPSLRLALKMARLFAVRVEDLFFDNNIDPPLPPLPGQEKR